MYNKTKNLVNRKFLAIILSIVSGAILAIHAYLGSYTRLMADDFCSVYFARRLNILRYVWYWYLNWGGRYSAIATDSFIENIGPAGLRFVPMFVILVWTIITFAALNQLIQKEVAAKHRILHSITLGLVMMTTIFAVTPMVQQVLYWWNGMRTYIPALISFSLHIGFLYWAPEKLKTKKMVITGSILSFLIIFFASGFNETFTAILFLFFAGLTGFGILSRRIRFSDPLFYLFAAASLASAISLLIMLKAPGTANRQGYFNASPNVMTTLKIAITGYWQYLVSIFTSAQTIWAVVGIILVSVWVGTGTERKKVGLQIVFITLGSGVFLSFASLVPAAYAFSEMPAARTYIVPTFVLVASLLFAGLMIGKHLAGTIKGTYHIGFMMLILIAVLSSTWINVRMLYMERKIFISFAERWDETNTQIEQAKLQGAKSVTIPALHVFTGPGGDPTDNPKYWVNKCYSSYYGITVLGPDPDLLQP